MVHYSYSFLFLALLLLILGVAVYLLVRRLNSRRDLSDGGVCGRCAYSVRGLATFICPECGGDLREVGVYTASLATSGVRLAPTLARKLIGWTVALTLAAITISPLVHHFCLPTVSIIDETYKLVGPLSGAFKEVAFHSHGLRLDATYRQRMRRHIPEFVDVTLTKNDGAPITLRVNIASLTEFGYEYETPDGRRVCAATGLNDEVILDWMNAGGVDVSDARAAVAAEANEIEWVVTNPTYASLCARQSVFQGQTANLADNCNRPLRGATAITVLFWVVVWLIGVWRVVRGHNRTQANILRNRRSSATAA